VALALNLILLGRSRIGFESRPVAQVSQFRHVQELHRVRAILIVGCVGDLDGVDLIGSRRDLNYAFGPGERPCFRPLPRHNGSGDQSVLTQSPRKLNPITAAITELVRSPQTRA